MKLFLEQNNFQYAAEQLFYSLFPHEKAEYAATKAEADIILKLSATARRTTASARVAYRGTTAVARRSLPNSAFQNPLQTSSALQRILKLAFYAAATKVLGGDPPWGAITGVRPVKIPTRILAAGGTPAKAENYLSKTLHVAPPQIALALDCARYTAALDAARNPRCVPLYVGIPFCPTRCAYCSFVSADVGKSAPLLSPFLAALDREIAVTAAFFRSHDLKVDSIYIGGGTPTTLSAPQLQHLMRRLAQHFDLSHCTEYTVEAGRPDTITAEKMAVLQQHGATRVSVNPQSMEDAVLRAMGRSHTPGQILQAYRDARESGIAAVNMDLIAGLPADSPEGFCRSLDQVLALDPENITVHTLSLKKGSALLLGDEKNRLPTEEAVGEMLSYSAKALRQSGYKPYYLYRQKFMSGGFENVGWTKPGFESTYNVCMMEELCSVVSLGGGGVTKLVSRETGSIQRIANPKYPKEYVENIEKILTQKETLPWPIS
ncbi:MAG: coproporphyrinogen dehydrogenase HemZ [Oscillospiraceae bacterium]